MAWTIPLLLIAQCGFAVDQQAYNDDELTLSATPRAEQSLPAAMTGKVVLLEAPGVSPAVPWVPIVQVAEEGFPVDPGEQLLAIDTGVLTNWIADRRLSIEIHEARLAIAEQELQAQMTATAEERRDLALRDRQLQSERNTLVGDPESERFIAATTLAQQKLRLATARRRLQALEAQREAGFGDEHDIRQAQRRVDEALAALPELEASLRLAGIGEETLSVALIDIERQLLDHQIRNDGALAQRQERLRRQLQAQLKLDGRRLKKMRSDDERDQTGLKDATKQLERGGLVQHRRGGVRPGVRLPASTAVRVADESHLRVEAIVPPMIAAAWRQFPDAPVTMRSAAQHISGQLIALSLRQHRRRPAQTVALIGCTDAELRVGQEIDIVVQLPTSGWSLPQWSVGAGGRVRNQQGEAFDFVGWSTKGRYYFQTPSEQFVLAEQRFTAAVDEMHTNAVWASVQPADTVPVPPPRTRWGGYYTSVIADAAVVKKGEQIATMHAHWMPTAPNLRIQIEEQTTVSRAQLEIDRVKAQQNRDKSHLAWLEKRVQATKSYGTALLAGIRTSTIGMARANAALVKARLQAQDAAEEAERALDPGLQSTLSKSAIRKKQLDAELATLRLQRKELDLAAERRQRGLSDWLWRQRTADTDAAAEQQARNELTLARQQYRNALLQARRKFNDSMQRVDWQRRMLASLTMHAPADGVIYRQIVRGEEVGVGTEINGESPLMIVTGDSLQAVAEIPESHFWRWQPNDPVTARLPGGQIIETVVAYRSPFCHAPRWRSAAWPGERVATVVVHLPVKNLAPGQQVQLLLGDQS